MKTRTLKYRSGTQAVKFLFLIIITALLNISLAFAQDDFNGPSSNDVPIDGGLSLLLAAGAGYVGKKAYDAKKKKAQKDKGIV